ncbi:formylglycine-generating enzyme family protein [Segatella copri]|uniref:formylglycine-generating enzyme family protein n=1 Tax=Segatella copri TaxID=165179 RepID=UPI0018854E7A|nr:formylglycine-generating enzyme family protein [Segatella copri]
MKAFTFFVLLLFSISVCSQELHVKSFGIAESDLSAQIQSRKDLNDKNCALVKVGIGLQGVQFEGNVVGQVVNNVGEYWVYMPQGSRMLKVKHPYYPPIIVTFANYSMEKLESNRTYELMLTVSGGIQSSQTQTLTIKYTPIEATVLVDNKRIKGSDGVAMANFPIGQHSFVVFCDGYESEEGMVKLKASAPSNLQITLSKEAKTALASTMGKEATNQNSVNSQNVKFFGKVVDVNGEPIIGAAIKENGTDNWAITDMEGNFFIDAKSPTVTITVLYVGWQSKQVELTAGHKEQITLIENKKKESETANSISIPVKDGINIEMIKVEAGTFMMGATKEVKEPYKIELPAHEVLLTEDYYIGKYEVTQALWNVVMDSKYSTNDGDLLPKNYVSWNDCQEFIEKLNKITGLKFRLPTEAEWEYAARGGKKSKRYLYSGSNNVLDVAWYDGNSSNKRHPVGTKQANELGIFDMGGNVSEWCQDLWGQYQNDSQINPLGSSAGTKHVLRGGNYFFDIRICYLSYRMFAESNYKDAFGGFRLALSE